MAEFFSKTAYTRLPAAVRKLPRNAQTVCIFLRLRKTEEQISREMEISPDETSRLANEVKRTLIVSGNYDMIAGPVFVSLDNFNGEGRTPEPVSGETAMEDSLLLKKFIEALKKGLSLLEQDERRILHLFFERRMTGNEIFDFQNRSGTGHRFKGHSDVFYFIEKTLGKLLSRVNETTPIGRGTLTVKGLKEILGDTGVPA